MRPGRAVTEGPLPADQQAPLQKFAGVHCAAELAQLRLADNIAADSGTRFAYLQFCPRCALLPRVLLWAATQVQ